MSSYRDLDLLFETESLKDKVYYQKLHADYDILSKKINKYSQWVEDNWNEVPVKETGNQ